MVADMVENASTLQGGCVTDDARSAADAIRNIAAIAAAIGGIGTIKNVGKSGKGRGAGNSGSSSASAADSASSASGSPKLPDTITKQSISRRTPGADGGSSEHIIERMNGDTISVTHRVTKDGQMIHQHQRHIGKHGTERSFPDAWIEYPTIGR
jgi:hypothetical protein